MIAQLKQMRFSHALLSSTVLPLREKFIISRATEAVTMAATVEISTIWLYTSCMISLAFVHTSAAKTGWENTMDIKTARQAQCTAWAA